MRLTKIVVTPLLLAVALTACVGPSAPAASAFPITAARPARPSTGSLRLSMRIPASAAKSVAISAATMDPGILIIDRMLDLRPAPAACTPIKDATLCTVVIPLGPGHWYATVETFDRTGGRGSELGRAARGFRIDTGAVTNVRLTIAPMHASPR